MLWHRCPEAEADMARLCRTAVTGKVRSEMRRLWGLDLTRCQVKSFRKTHGIASPYGHSGRFEKGETPYTKGRPWDEWMSPEGREASSRTLYGGGRRGCADEMWRPVGTETLRSDGYVWVKVNDDGPDARGCLNDRWRLRSHVVWEREHGPVPEGHVIVHVDGDPANDDPANLECVPKSVMATINNVGIRYADRETFEVAALTAEVRSAVARARRGGAS